MTSTSVVLPEPVAPTSATLCPFEIVRSTSTSAASLAVWNGYRRALRRSAGGVELRRAVRAATLLLGALAATLALTTSSVAAPWALCGDLVIASEDARIGTPYSRMWGAYLSGMWLHRLGLTKAKEYALTGKPLSGREAADIGLINEAVPFGELEATAPAFQPACE